MSEYITDISKWNENYPFLYNVLFTYEQFEKPVEGDASENTYYSLCDIILKYLGENVERYRSGCMKLFRNLKFYAHFTNHFQPTQERCDILYNWIKNAVRDDKIKENIIDKCFEEYDTAKEFMNDHIKCSYKSNNEGFEKPMNIILLNIFNNNIQIIKDTLIGRNASNKLSCQKFVCEAVKIYKDMYDTYCLNKKHVSGKLEKTCLKLSQFEKSYNIFHGDLGILKYYIPSLNDSVTEISTKCSSDEKMKLLAFGGVEIPEYTSVDGMTTRRGNSDDSSQRDLSGSPEVGGYPSGVDLSTPYGNGDSPMRKTITTTVGTVAGASSLLAFLYRFTPAKRLVHSGFGGTRGRISTNLYEVGTNELLFNGMEGEDFNSYNQRYDIGYSPM